MVLDTVIVKQSVFETFGWKEVDVAVDEGLQEACLVPKFFLILFTRTLGISSI